VAFPTDPLGIKAEINLDGTWTDITTYVRSEQGVNIVGRGRSNEQSFVGPAKCQVTLDNRDGRFSPRNPSGAYYGSLKRNTPIRVYVDPYDTYLRLHNRYDSSNVATGNYASTTDKAALDITGDIDIRIDVSPDAWSATQDTILASKVGTGVTQISWMFLLRADNTLRLLWTTDGSTSTQLFATSTAGIDPSRRIALRATLDVNNGAGGHSVNFYTSDTISGSWTQLGSTVTTSGTTSVFSGDGSLEIGTARSGIEFYTDVSRFSGKVYGLELYNGIAGTRVANPDFTAQTVGDTSFADDHGNTWTVNNQARITSDNVRFAGEVAQWPVEWDISGLDSYVKVQADGILRRLQQGGSPLRTALYRALANQSTMVGYWPMEDGADSTSAAPAGQGTAGRVSGVTFGEDAGTLAGTKSVATIAAGGSIRAEVTVEARWSVLFYFKMGADPASDCETLRLGTSGTGKQWYLTVTSNSFKLDIYDADGVLFDTANFSRSGVDVTDWVTMRIDATQNGSNIEWSYWWANPNDDIVGSGTQTVAGTLGNLLSWQLSGHAASSGVSVAHLYVDSSNDTVEDNLNFKFAAVAWNGEAAQDRLDRLCSEEGVPFTLYGGGNLSQAMGIQREDTLVNLLEECATVDGGILFEARDVVGLAYYPVDALYNNLSTSLSYSGHELSSTLRPIEDDQTLRNDVTVRRPDGSSARAIRSAGANNVQDPPDGVGRYDESRDANVQSDDQLAGIAQWWLHLGTWDEARYPSVRVNLARSQISGDAVLTEQLKTLDVGHGLSVTDPPSQWPPDDIELIIQGYSEFMSQYEWTLDFQGSPAGPYKIAEVEHSEYSYVGSDGSTVTSDFVAGTDTSLSVTIADGYPVWDDGDAPFDIITSGVRLTVTAISGASSPQTFTVTQTPVNGVTKTVPAGATVDIFHKSFIGL
jgi:hypothetical protein